MAWVVDEFPWIHNPGDLDDGVWLDNVVASGHCMHGCLSADMTAAHDSDGEYGSRSGGGSGSSGTILLATAGLGGCVELHEVRRELLVCVCV
jgi:hypothetical protein